MAVALFLAFATGRTGRGRDPTSGDTAYTGRPDTAGSGSTRRCTTEDRCIGFAGHLAPGLGGLRQGLAGGVQQFHDVDGGGLDFGVPRNAIEGERQLGVVFQEVHEFHGTVGGDDRLDHGTLGGLEGQGEMPEAAKDR